MPFACHGPWSHTSTCMHGAERCEIASGCTCNFNGMPLCMQMARRKQELVEMLGKVSARDADLVPILDNLPDSSLLLTVDYESREALVVALRKMDAMQSAGAKI